MIQNRFHWMIIGYPISLISFLYRIHTCTLWLSKIAIKNLLVELFYTCSVLDTLRVPSLKLTVRTWKWMVGRLLDFFGRLIFKGFLLFVSLFLGGVIVNPGYVDQGWRRARAGECTLMTAVMGDRCGTLDADFFSHSFCMNLVKSIIEFLGNI